MKSFTNYARLGNSSTSITSALTSNKKFLEPDNLVYSTHEANMYSYPGQYSDFVTYDDETNSYADGNKLTIPEHSYHGKRTVPPVIDTIDTIGSCKSCKK